MPRRIRVQFAGALYHVMARGNERREIFRDDRDRLRFLETLGDAVKRSEARAATDRVVAKKLKQLTKLSKVLD